MDRIVEVFCVQREHDAGSEWFVCITMNLEPVVACAVAHGILRKNELPPELVAHIATLIGFYEADLSPSVSHREG